METTQNTGILTGIPTMRDSEPLSQGIKVGASITIILVIAVSSFFAGKLTRPKDLPQPSITPTPSTTVTPTPTETQLPTPSETEEPTASPSVPETGTPTATPTIPPVTISRKTFNLTVYSDINTTQPFILDVRSDVKATPITFNYVYNSAIVLQKGNKNFMLIVAPEQNSPVFDLEQQGYTSARLVASNNIDRLYRVHARQILEASGPYNFAIAYVTKTALRTGDACFADYQYNKTTSPCAIPYGSYSKGVASIYAFGAYCSIDKEYIPLCDQVMKTFEMKDSSRTQLGVN